MYTTACDRCRKMRMKCVRPSRGQDANEICERCQDDNAECSTTKRTVGRQKGVKNRRTKAVRLLEEGRNEVLIHDLPLALGLFHRDTHVVRDVDHLPNPLHVLASEAVRRQPTPSPESDMNYPPSDLAQPSSLRNSHTILDSHADWASKVHPSLGRDLIATRLDRLLNSARDDSLLLMEEPSVFGGRVDMARPDVAPEHDVITLQMLTLSEAQHLFDSFMNLITNGSMYFDPRLHTLSWIRGRSSFLLTVILAIASTYRPLCSSGLLHAQLMNHAARLESNIRNNHYKSIEIVQALLLLASWSEVPHTLCRDKTWLYVSHATALAVELRLDTPVPYCIQTDVSYDLAHHDLLVRNAHRACLLLYIHDRNMAMVAGRYPIFPESSLTSQYSLDQWGKHISAYKYDAPLCASVSLRKLVIEVHHKMATRRLTDFPTDKDVIDRTVAEWRRRWHNETQSTLEYDIIARFSTFVMTLTLLKKGKYLDGMEAEARRACEVLAFEVCCTTINHYKSWTGLLNSATFDTSMVAFCAIYTIQTINHLSSPYLSDWSLFRLATLQELVFELEEQAKARHRVNRSDSMDVVDAMARQLSRGIKLVLRKKQAGRGTSSPGQSVSHLQQSVTAYIPGAKNSSNQIPDHEFNEPRDRIYSDVGKYSHNPIDSSNHPTSDAAIEPQHLDELNQLLFANNAISFMPEWGLESLLPTTSFNWDGNPMQDWPSISNVPMFDFDDNPLHGVLPSVGPGL